MGEMAGHPGPGSQASLGANTGGQGLLWPQAALLTPQIKPTSILIKSQDLQAEQKCQPIHHKLVNSRQNFLGQITNGIQGGGQGRQGIILKYNLNFPSKIPSSG